MTLIPDNGLPGARLSWARYAVEDTYTRRRLKLSARGDFPALDQLYGLWRRNPASPDLARDAALLMKGYLHIVDTPEGCSPAEYPVRLVGCRVAILPVVTRLSEFQCKTWVDAAAHDYNMVVTIDRPALHRISARWNLESVSYVRLILPVRQGGRVSGLLIGIDEYQEEFAASEIPA